MRKKLQWSSRTGIPIIKVGEQLITLPLAISDHLGNPLKGQKSYITKALENHYKTSPQDVFLQRLPPTWKPECVLLEGMFLINIHPLGTHTTFGQFAAFLMRRHIIPHFLRGCRECHVIFDNPGRLQATPKYSEQERHDKASPVGPDHVCQSFEVDTKLPKKWRENVINCRNCKRHLVCFLTEFMLNNIHPHLSPHQKFYAAGGFEDENRRDTAWFIEGVAIPIEASHKSPASSRQPEPLLSSNSEEADTRIWLHVRRTDCNKVLVLSPDTDVYFIGMPLNRTEEKEVMVQISKMNARELKLLHMKHLILALKSDPNLSSIETSTLPLVLQVLFVVTGCDYISFFFRE